MKGKEMMMSHTLSSAGFIAAFVDRLAAGEVSLDNEAATRELTVTGATAAEILTAADRPGVRLLWAGTVAGDLHLPSLEAGLQIVGLVDGNLHLHRDATIAMNVHLDGQVNGNVHLDGQIYGYVGIAGTIYGDLAIDGAVRPSPPRSLTAATL